MMRECITEKLGKGKDYIAEATYYCDETEYQYQEARKMFMADLAFEEENKKKLKKK
jgi:hypothetical protein